MTKRAVTIFSESKALRISKKIIPKEIDAQTNIFFKKIFNEKVIAKNNGMKKAEN